MFHFSDMNTAAVVRRLYRRQEKHPILAPAFVFLLKRAFVFVYDFCTWYVQYVTCCWLVLIVDDCCTSGNGLEFQACGMNE